MMRNMNTGLESFRLTVAQMNGTAERAARFFFGWWSWRGSLPVCENC
jgi:hypothetical protein